ncbi:MAG: lysophospholipid acyltransferase family protein [Flavobacteriales bacterium]|nr:lysophospholipid acyltransferase family protein [Flavobacteriales bacterium]
MLSKLNHIILSPLLWLVSIVPLKVLYIKSLILSNFFFYRNDIIKSNIDNAFNNLNFDNKKKIFNGFKIYFLNLICEIIKMISVNKKFYSNRITIKNIEILDQYYNRNQTVILMMGHHNNWEWAGQIISIKSKQKFVSVYKKLSSSFFDYFMCRLRAKNGADVIEMNDIIKHIYDNKETKIIGLIADQNPVVNDTTNWTNFFDKSVPVIDGPEKIARKMNFPVLFCNMNKIKEGYYTINFEVINENPKTSNIGDITNKFFKRLEEKIKEEPNNYLWSHNRWKHTKKI